MSLPKSITSSLPMSILIGIYIIINPILALMVSVISNPSLSAEKIIFLSVILTIAMGIISAVFIVVFHKLEKNKQEFEKRRLDLEEKKIEVEEKKIAVEGVIKAQQAKMSPLDVSPIMQQIATSPQIMTIVEEAIKKAYEKSGLKEKKKD